MGKILGYMALLGIGVLFYREYKKVKTEKTPKVNN
jgi:hypothetical protein